MAVAVAVVGVCWLLFLLMCGSTAFAFLLVINVAVVAVAVAVVGVCWLLFLLMCGSTAFAFLFVVVAVAVVGRCLLFTFCC